MRRDTQGPFPISTVLLGFLSIFKTSQALSPFEAFNSTCLSSCQSDMRPPVMIRWGTKALSRVSTGDSDIRSSWEMKDEPAFKSLLGYPALFRVMACRCQFHLRPQTQGPSHIPIAEINHLLKCSWKVGIPLESNPENQL